MKTYSRDRYALEHAQRMESPCLVWHRDIIRANTARTIAIAGKAGRLWPHVKSHKTRELVLMQMEAGIERFKCATIAEAEMVASCGAAHVLLAYPLLGPNIARFIELCGLFGGTRFWAIGDDLEQLRALAEAARAAGLRVPVLLDVNTGQDRTGVAPEGVVGLFTACSGLAGLEVLGLHCYDGHIHDPEPAVRRERVAACRQRLEPVLAGLAAAGLARPVMVMGGTPTLPCHAADPEVYLSPGTVFLMDWGYDAAFPDLGLEPAAVVLCRVISHPAPGLFTLDLGNKALAADPDGQRGVIAGFETLARPVAQNEEHWIFAMQPGHEDLRPPVGSVQYVIPTHICPTSALHQQVWVAEAGRLVGRWDIAARNRKLGV